MRVKTKQFGELDFDEDLVLYFPKGIIGFEDCKRFVIINDEEYEPFRWLISVDKEEIGFPLLNPFLVVPDYGKELPEHLEEALFSSDKLMDIFGIVTIKGKEGKVTINLKSPVVIDYDKKEGEQIILTSDDLSVAHPIT